MLWYQKLIGGDGKTKVSAKKLWQRILVDRLKKNQSVHGPLRSYNWYASNMAMYSEKDNVVFLYSIDSYPGQIPISFREDIRNEARGTVRVSFVSRIDRTNIEWNSAKIKSRLRTWQAVEEESDDVSAYNYRENVSKMDVADRRRESLKYLADAEIRRNRRLLKISTLIVVAGTRGEDFDKTIEAMESFCANMGIQINRVSQNIPEYLKVFSPFSTQHSKVVAKDVGNAVIPDEITARFSSYTQGKVGDLGIYWGDDIMSGSPVYKVIKKTNVAAENILVSAETGGGKSFFVKMLLLQMMGDPNFRGTIMDIEGDEYLPLATYIGISDTVVILNMAEGQGSYFDPVEIFLTGDMETDADMLNLSMSYTLSIFRTLLGTIAKNEWSQIILNDAISETYLKAGVDINNPNTWVYSQGLTLYHVYSSIMEVAQKESSFSSDRDRVSAVNLVQATLARYFEPGGSRTSVFRNRVTVEEIRDAKLVVCSFGMRGKSPSVVDPVQMSLTELYSSAISHIRSVSGHSDGVYSVKVWEEFQRWGQFSEDSNKIITTALTGGRKLGDINIVVTNRASDLISADSKTGIFENTTSFAIGAIGDAKVREQLATRLSVEKLLPELNAMSTKRKDKQAFKNKDGTVEEVTASTVSSLYDKAFLVYLDKEDATVARMRIPKELAESKLFLTGVDLAKEDLAAGNTGEGSFYEYASGFLTPDALNS